jgi:phosphoribosyl 1,2-cyclic phosphodiesterase
MRLKIIGTGSSGNCYLLTTNTEETLILDAGLRITEIKKGLNWDLRHVFGCIVTHEHKDHNKAISALESIGVQIFAPYRNDSGVKFKAPWKVRTFDLTDLNDKWMHTNGDVSECPCYGFWIQHPEMGTMIYATDTELIKWRFKNVNHILLGVNYDPELLPGDDAKTTHVVRGHMSIDTACDFVKANASDQLQNVIMCHLSNENADAGKFIEKMKAVVPRVNVDVAEPGKYWELKNPGECPF